VTSDHVKHFFLDFAEIAFSNGEEVENEFRQIADFFKHRFLDLKQIAFLAG
jgi:hypothetical protein